MHAHTSNQANNAIPDNRHLNIFAVVSVDPNWSFIFIIGHSGQCLRIPQGVISAWSLALLVGVQNTHYLDHLAVIGIWRDRPNIRL